MGSRASLALGLRHFSAHDRVKLDSDNFGRGGFEIVESDVFRNGGAYLFGLSDFSLSVRHYLHLKNSKLKPNKCPPRALNNAVPSGNYPRYG